jgi:cob(I)alamin adenosyltransferase
MYGRRVPKDEPRVDSYGCVDELNAALGLARATAPSGFVADTLLSVQKELIVVMGELATLPQDLQRYRDDGYQQTGAAMVDGLTAMIDELEKDKSLYPRDWVIPGSSLPAAALDLARTSCRRAERSILALDDINPEILRYLNRLSDLLWLLARYLERQPQTT